MKHFRTRAIIGAGCVFALLAATGHQSLEAQQFALVIDAPQPNAGVQNAMRRQIHRMLEPMLKVELSFASRVAELNAEERKALIAAAVKWLDQFADDFAAKQDRNAQQMWMQGIQQVVIGGPRNTEDVRETIEHGVAKLVAATLTAEKAAIYERQAARRTEFRRDVVVANLVEQLDEELILAPEQRQKLTSLLTEHWDEKWAPQLESFALARNYFLPVPKQWVRPELTAAQRAVFDRLNNDNLSQRVIVGGLAFGGQGNDVINDIDFNEQSPAADDSANPGQPAADDSTTISD